MTLQGHSEEVTSVAWCPTDFTKVRQQACTGCLFSVSVWSDRRIDSIGSPPSLFLVHFPSVELYSCDIYGVHTLPDLRSFAARLLHVLTTTPFGSGGFIEKWMERSLLLVRLTWWAGLAPHLHQVSPASACPRCSQLRCVWLWGAHKRFSFCKAASMRAEMTPAKSRRSESLGGLASPRPAACAPSGAALPLSSSTTSPAPCKELAVHQKTPSSIKQWLSPSQGSPGQVPQRRVLCLAGNSPPTERRVKRRLDNVVPAADGCRGADECDGVAELYPAAKRSRTMPDLCCPAPGNQVDSDGDIEDEKEAPLRQTGKENFSPRPSDWLSAMAKKMRKGRGRSPSTPRSPSASKKPDGKAPASPVSPVTTINQAVQTVVHIHRGV